MKRRRRLIIWWRQAVFSPSQNSTLYFIILLLKHCVYINNILFLTVAGGMAHSMINNGMYKLSVTFVLFNVFMLHAIQYLSCHSLFREEKSWHTVGLPTLGHWSIYNVFLMPTCLFLVSTDVFTTYSILGHLEAFSCFYGGVSNFVLHWHAFYSAQNLLYLSMFGVCVWRIGVCGKAKTLLSCEKIICLRHGMHNKKKVKMKKKKIMACQPAHEKKEENMLSCICHMLTL